MYVFIFHGTYCKSTETSFILSFVKYDYVVISNFFESHHKKITIKDRLS